MSICDVAVTSEVLDIRSIQTDVAYQRTRSKSMEQKIIKAGFNDLLCGQIIVGRRSDGGLWVVDGQTRMNAAKSIGRTELPAMVFPSTGRQFEAEWFVVLNKDRRGVKAMDVYRAAVEWGEPQAVEVDAAMKRFGLIAGYGKKWPHVPGIAKIRDAQACGHLYDVLTLITSTWAGKFEALGELAIGAVLYFVKRFPKADQQRAIERWRKHDPTYFLQSADPAKAAGGSRYAGVALALMEQYNKGLRSNRLEW